MIRLLILFAATLVAGACSTPYQERGLMGGVSVSRIDATTLQITGRGNGFTDMATVRDHVLLKSAEATLAAGYGHYQVMAASDASRREAHTNPGYFSFNRYSAFYMPATTTLIDKPGADLHVKMYAGRKPPDAPRGVYDATEVMAYLGPKYIRSNRAPAPAPAPAAPQDPPQTVAMPAAKTPPSYAQPAADTPRPDYGPTQPANRSGYDPRSGMNW